jgi:hypothetical protein
MSSIAPQNDHSENPDRSVSKSIPKVTPLGEDMHIGDKVRSKEEYQQAKNKFVAEYESYRPGFLSGAMVHDPATGEAKWNQYYPEGYPSWAGEHVPEFNGYGQRRMAEKIDELVDTVNKLTKVIDLLTNSPKAKKKGVKGANDAPKKEGTL